jgi:two-component system phosphate regulon sensor histidine kinase PhoR
MEFLEKSRTIWIVDDSATDAERVCRVLKQCHYHVEIINDGAIALERLASGATPDLLLLDWIMPEISGIEVCKYIRASQSKISNVPIILLTAQHGTDEIIEAFASGANDYISKPFVDEELKARVTALIQNKHLFERAEEAEADVRALLTNAPDPIFVIDAQGKISYVNEEGLKIFNLPTTEIIGKHFETLIPGITLQTISIGKGEAILPIPDVRLNEKLFSPSIRVLPSDNASTTTVVLRDVTARRMTESRRLDFYSMIAHDLRTPLTSVLLRMQMALRGKNGLLPAKHLSDLQKSETTLRSLAGMINDFLELARFEGIGHKIDASPVNIGELTKDTMDDYLPLLEKSKLTWTFSGLDSNEMVLGDHRRISQVLSNLIGNAIKFNTEGGNIDTTLIASKEYVEMSIKDTGRGIAKEDIPTLFERFSRVTATPGDSVGSGLGLMIVREIIEAHGGIIGVDTEMGIGSRFWFRIPKEKLPIKLQN